MKTPLILAVGALTLLTKLAGGSEIITLVAESPGNQYGYSQTITLEQGDSAEVTGGGSHGGEIELTVGGRTFIEKITLVDGAGGPRLFNRINVAGPAAMRLRVSGSNAIKPVRDPRQLKGAQSQRSRDNPRADVKMPRTHTAHSLPNIPPDAKPNPHRPAQHP